RLDRADRGGTRHRVATESAAQAAGVDSVHHFRTAGHRRQRKPAADPLRRGDQIGDDVLVFASEHVPGARKPGLYLVGDEYDAVVSAPFGQGGKKSFGRNDETALTLDRFDHDGGKVLRTDLLVHHRDGTLRGIRTRNLG